jgi:glycerol-3-phosphate dehydrogenase
MRPAASSPTPTSPSEETVAWQELKVRIDRIVEEEAAVRAHDVLSRRTDWALDAPDSAARARLVAFVEDVLSSRGAQGAR